MERRDFLVTSAMAAAAAGTATSLGAQATSPAGRREFYEWTRYELRMGTGQSRLTQYLRDTYFPALSARDVVRSGRSRSCSVPGHQLSSRS